MGNVTRLDRVSVFGNTLSFLIPHDWIEGQSEDDHYLIICRKLNPDGFVYR
jgi:hypothetical protein